MHSREPLILSGRTRKSCPAGICMSSGLLGLPLTKGNQQLCCQGRDFAGSYVPHICPNTDDRQAKVSGWDHHDAETTHEI